MVNNSSKLNQLVFIDPFRSSNAVVAFLCFGVASVNLRGLEVINLKGRGLSAWNSYYIKINLVFSIVLCLPFVFRWAFFPSMVLHPFLGFSAYFFFDSRLLYFICSRKNSAVIWLTCAASSSAVLSGVNHSLLVFVFFAFNSLEPKHLCLIWQLLSEVGLVENNSEKPVQTPTFEGLMLLSSVSARQTKSFAS